MTLSPVDGIRSRHTMSTVIEHSKYLTDFDPAKGKPAPVVTTTFETITPPEDSYTPTDEAIDMKPAGGDAKSFSTQFKVAPTLQPTFPLPASTRLQKLLKETDKLIVCPGVYDGLSARIAHEVGFDALYMVSPIPDFSLMNGVLTFAKTGAGTSCSRLGMADLGLATLADMRAQADMICNLDPYGAPVIADIDGGYGGPMMIDRAVKEYIRAGVAGFHIEDQVSLLRLF